MLQAAAEKGRFRSFILKVFSNFVKDRLRQEQAVKRKQDSPDAERVDDLPELASDTPLVSAAFDALWARQVLAQTIERMQQECLDQHREELWHVLAARVLDPAIDNKPPMPYGQLVANFGLRSPSQASNLLITAKRVFVRILHETVRETVTDDRDIEHEILELKRILGS